MAFGNVSVDTGSFAQPDTSRGLLANFMLMQQLKNSQLEQQRFQADQDKEQRIQQAMSGFDPANPESGLAAIYQANPEMGAKVHASIAERRKSEAEAQKVGFEAQRAGLEAQGAQAAVPQEFKTGLAKQFGSFWHSMPPNQRDPRLADRWLDSKIQEAQQMYPQWAPAVEAIRSNPDWINHARSLTPDPYEADQREVSKYQQQRQFDNQLPMTAEQRDASARGWGQMDLEQQRMGQAQQNSQYDRGQKYWDSVQSEQKRFDGLAPVQTFKVAAAEMDALTKLAEQDNKAGDLGIILGAAKIGDPIGSVREGDQILWSGTGSWFETLRSQARKIQEGGRLTPRMRADILQEARTKVNALRGGYENEVKQIETTAQQRGFEPGHLKTGAQSIAPSKLEQVWDALKANPNNAAQIKAVAKKHGIPDSMLW
jgi:hypothetical protein